MDISEECAAFFFFRVLRFQGMFSFSSQEFGTIRKC
jgi:hypothetical protein